MAKLTTSFLPIPHLAKRYKQPICKIVNIIKYHGVQADNRLHYPRYSTVRIEEELKKVMVKSKNVKGLMF